jgi:putative transposase
VWNWTLEQIKRINGEERRIPGGLELRRLLNSVKGEQFPWMCEVSKCCPQEAIINVDKAIRAYFDSRKGQRKGKKTGFPKFKKKGKCRESFKLTGTIIVKERAIILPVLGEIRLFEKNYIPTDVHVCSATVTKRANRWFVSVNVKMEIPEQTWEKDEDPVIGLDLGVKTLAVCSDGQTFENPKALTSKLKKLRRLNKSLHRKVEGSQNRKKAAAELAKLHFEIACIRQDAIHKITTELTRTKSAIVIEDLNVSGMLRNHCLARAIADCGFGEFKRQLLYKGERYGCQIILAPRFFPSSKTCSECGWIKEDLTLKDREWTCEECGVIHDRDHNAAVNLLQWAISNGLIHASSAGMENSCGGGSSGQATCGGLVLGETAPDEAGTRREISL